jgi:thioesterase domain-containing protein
MRRIEQDFGVRVPLVELFTASTVEALARRLEQHARIATGTWKSLVKIHQTPGAPVLFLVHGAGGNLLLYRELAARLAPEISVFGFQSQGLDRRSPPLTKVEDMAAWYVTELLAQNPAGPIHLGGYCMGGAVAYEMARLLRLRGHEVGLLAMFDTYNLALVKRPKGCRRWSFLGQKLRFHLANLRQLGTRDLLGYVAEKLRMAREFSRDRLLAAGRGWHRLGKPSEHPAGAEAAIEAINHSAAWQYRPLPYAGRVTLYRPQENYDFFSDSNMGWKELVEGGLEIVSLPVNPHAMLIEPHASLLAAALRARITAGGTLSETAPRETRRPESMLARTGTG